jgi:precorrin-6x reductase
MKILLFGGTTEGRVLAERLGALGAQVTVSVATPLGAEELSSLRMLDVWVGRKSADEMAVSMCGFDLCIDATHPYAVEATANIAAACRQAGAPLRRLLREPCAAGDAIRVGSAAEAAAFLVGTEGAILLTTGAKELSAFRGLESARLYARVLPTCESIRACEEIGLPHRNILALQGPFSQKLNEAMLEQYQIAWLVTKDGGTAGGLEEKLRAAEHVGARVVLIARPEDSGEGLEELLKSVEEMMA